MRKLCTLLAAIFAVAGLTFGAASASASTAAKDNPAGLRFSNVSQFYSQSLAGTFLNGNGTVSFAGTWRQFSLPDESTASPAIAPDHVAEGLVLTQYVTGGFADAEAMVWDDPAGCGAGTWTLEYT